MMGFSADSPVYECVCMCMCVCVCVYVCLPACHCTISFSADSPINIIGEGDAILGDLEGDDADGGFTALQLLHCLP